MRITITQDFDSAEAAAEFLARVGNPAFVAGALNTAEIVEAFDANRAQVAAAAKPARKPRNDAGKPRQPYGPRTSNAGGDQGGTQPTGTTGAPTPAAPVSPPAPVSAPAQPSTAAVTAAPSKEGVGQGAAAPAAGEFPATLDGARAVMKKLNDAKGKGMDACIQALKDHGVNRISDLPKEKYGEFVAYILAQLPKDAAK